MLKNFIISVDGPAGSGKARIAKYIAKEYNLYHLDSGILYRRLAKFIYERKVDFKKKNQLNQLIKNLDYLSPRSHKTLRKEKISNLSSKIAVIPSIREYINFQQKNITKKMFKNYIGCVVDGRDIGSKVFKNAKIKLFIQVSPEIRAKRRHKQLIELGEKSIYSRILKEINLRDKTDINRSNSPLVKPKGAIVVNNSRSFNETTKNIKKIMDKIF